MPVTFSGGLTYGLNMFSKSREIDMTSGPLVKKIFIFAVPLALIILLQMLYNSCDLAVVGKFSSKALVSQASIGSVAPINTLIVNFFVGFSTGTNIALAHKIGAKDKDATSKILHTSILFAVFLGLTGSIVGIVFSKKILILMNCKDELLYYASLYLRITFIGLPFNVLYNFGTAVLRSIGDTKRPLIFLAFSGGLNVILNLFFVLVFKMNVEGVAIATVVSQFVSMVLVFLTLTNKNSTVKLEFKKLKIDKESLYEVVTLGFTTAVCSSIYGIANIITNSCIIELGDAYVAGNSIKTSIADYITIAPSSMGQTIVAFTAQNYGAKNFKFIKKVIATALIIGLILTLIITAFILIFKMPLIRIFTDESEVTAHAKEAITILVPYYFIWTLSEAFINSSRGMGDKIVPTVLSIVNICVLRLLYIYLVFPTNKSFTLLLYVYPISWLISAVSQYIWFAFSYKRTLKRNSFL